MLRHDKGPAHAFEWRVTATKMIEKGGNLIAQALATFPGATISVVKPLGPPPEPEFLAAIPEDDDPDLLDDDDPFEEDL